MFDFLFTRCHTILLLNDLFHCFTKCNRCRSIATIAKAKTVFTSFANDFTSFEQFKDYVNVNCDDEDYKEKGTHIKWNPAVKTAADRKGLWDALLDDRIDIIASDHAPHTLEEKSNSYMNAPSGGPLVQHTLLALLEKVKQQVIPIEKLVEKACHNPAKIFQIEKRGFIKEGYFADLVLVDTNAPQTVHKENILYKCGWSPFEGVTFKSRVSHTFVNGILTYHNLKFKNKSIPQRLTFNRS